MLYVKVNDTDKTWIVDVSTEQKDGYVAKPGLLNDQKIALLDYPDKCYVDETGAVITPNQLPMSDAEKQAAQNKIDISDFKDSINSLNKQITDMQANIDTLTNDKTKLQSALNNANADNTNLKSQIQALQKQALMYTQQIMQINNDLQKAKEGK
mgnify:CR=1 FL=1